MKDRAYNIAINPKHDKYQKRLASVVYKCFEKKIGSGESEYRWGAIWRITQSSD